MNHILPSLVHLTSIDLHVLNPTPPHPTNMLAMLRTLCSLTTLQHMHLTAADQPQCLGVLQHVDSLQSLHELTVVNAGVNHDRWMFDREPQGGGDILPVPLGHTPTPLVLPQRLRRLHLQQSVAVHGSELTHIGSTLVGLTHLYVLGCCIRSNDAACAVAGRGLWFSIMLACGVL